MRDVALESVDDDETVVEEIRLHDLHSVDEDFSCGRRVAGSGGGDGEAAVGGEGLDFSAEGKPAEEMDGVEAEDSVFLEEERGGARWACEERGVRGGEDGGGGDIGEISGGGSGGQVPETEVGEDGDDVGCGGGRWE